MKIAIIGIRGIPVMYSAFETFGQVLSEELVKKNYSVSVYCRNKYVSKDLKSYKGATLIHLPSLERVSFSTITHSLLATLHAVLLSRYDLILFLGVGNTIYSLLPRLFGIKTIVHIDGLDWKRKKWNYFSSKFLKLSELLTKYLPTLTITDSEYMQKYYHEMYGKKIPWIPFGFFPTTSDGTKILSKYKLKKKKYFAWVGRLVPENFVEEFTKAFSELEDQSIKCVIIGDDLYSSTYKSHILNLAKKNKNIIHTGFIPHPEVISLVNHSLAYIETKRSGGTHMALVEAMGTGTLIISNDLEANKGVLGKTALFYSLETGWPDLLKQMKLALSDTKKTLRTEVKTRAIHFYSWKTVINKYVILFDQITS